MAELFNNNDTSNDEHRTRNKYKIGNVIIEQLIFCVSE